MNTGKRTPEPTASRRGDVYVTLSADPEATIKVVVLYGDALFDLPTVQAARNLRDALNDVLGEEAVTP